ncbi:DMT family transporter [uncultured Roseovarius sp.]|uniref:DMT family transporter n=1 Tax=uncultured Roseovarius sp. TaxID=293344 RepID=UPI002617F7E6|nr:DMT family transporter [uncultured Roseovarius sp.]
MGSNFRLDIPSLKMIAAMVLAGSIGVFVVESGEPALTVVFFRCLIGGGTLLLYCLIAHPKILYKLTRRTFFLMCLSGLTMAANWLLFFMAYSHASISMVTTVYHVYPFVLLFASAMLFHEKITLPSFAWAALAFAGVALVAMGGNNGAVMDVTGLALTMAAMTCYAITLLITKYLSNSPTDLLSVVQLLVGAILLLPLAGMDGLRIGADSWKYLLVIGVVHTALLYMLLYGAVQSLDTNRVAILSFLYPLTALIFDVLVYDVRPGTAQILGLAAIIIAVLGERLKLHKSKDRCADC